jgi:putative transcriptional regulator
MNKIVGYRNMMMMTQTDMAKYLGISLQSYWKKEKGKSSFSDNEKRLIKQLLSPHFPGITIDEIFFDK